MAAAHVPRNVPQQRWNFWGKNGTWHDLADELVKDRVYFEPSGGGVTLSGGEAALQNDFCLALLKELKEQGNSDSTRYLRTNTPDFTCGGSALR